MELWKLLLAWMGLALMLRTGEAQLNPNFYQVSCPSVESIVRRAVLKKLNQTIVTVPATLRLFFHDCFVEVSFQTFHQAH